MKQKGSIPRNDAEKAAVEVTSFLRLELALDTFIGGSLLRGNEFVNDVDIGFIPATNVESTQHWWKEIMKLICTQLHTPAEMPEGFKHVCGKEIARVWYQGIQVDLWASERYYWGPMKMFIAGSGKLNMIQRVKAKKLGVKLSNKGLFALDTDEDLGMFETEESVYQFLGWPWLPYSKRNL